MNPADVLKQLQAKRIAEVRKCVAYLATLDFANTHPEYPVAKKMLAPHRELINRARAAREQVRQRFSREKKEWPTGPAEYEEIERHLIEQLGPTMSQSEYQALVKAYEEKIKSESIDRWRKIPIIILQGGLPS